MKPTTIEQITKRVTEHFPTFGGGKVRDGNPLSIWTKNAPPMFALGVDVKEVVAFVLGLAREGR